MLIILVAAIAGACASSTPSSSAAAQPTAAPPTAIQTPTPVATNGSSRHADPQLEALLPGSLGGMALDKASQRGIDLPGTGQAFAQMLANLGRSPSDFTVASADARDSKAAVGIWRIAGADPTKLLDEFIKAVQGSSTTPLTVAQVTIADKQVTQIGVPGQLTQGPIYVYVKDGLLMFVETPDPVLAEDGLSRLP